ncbi:MAG: TerB family tellurite resistance protein, partial [Litoreibacter sp.]|nr:TerB family tellurite resistance protein [Litoreibacter sp.]
MFEQLRALFQDPAGYETPLPPTDAQHALGALMVRAAKADDAYLFAEIELVDRILATLHGLNPVEAAQMRAACERLEAEMPDTANLSAILARAISAEERDAMLSALWSVVFADGVEHEAEDRVLHQIEAVLGVPKPRARDI